jgi:hypothetical protein
MDLDEVVRQARAGSLEAFEAVTRRFQHMALGSALALVRDPQQAQDVVQGAFVAAWFSLPTLASRRRFPAGSAASSVTRPTACYGEAVRWRFPWKRSRLLEEPTSAPIMPSWWRG